MNRCLPERSFECSHERSLEHSPGHSLGHSAAPSSVRASTNSRVHPPAQPVFNRFGLRLRSAGVVMAAALSVVSAMGLATLLSFHSTTQAQSVVRPFPAAAKRGIFEVQTWPLVLINGSAERLSPGARIRGPNNLLMLSGQLVGQRLVVNYLRDAQGMVHEVWVLNATEAQLERAGSEPTKNWAFESDPVKTQ